MKNLLFISFASILFACGGGQNTEDSSSAPPGKAQETGNEVSDQEDPRANKGIGPISSVELGEIDQAMVEEGKATYNSMCSACHMVDKDYIGPSPKGILDRRSPEWIMNLILNPTEMLEKDSIAKDLLEKANGVPMVNLGLTEEEARAILEYFRTIN